MPPGTGIVHQVNLEYLARVVFVDDRSGQAYPDTLVGTDSHTTMINGLGVLGWGVGGIEAEAAMLGQPMPMLIPQRDRLPARRRAARGRDRDRPRPDRHRAAAQEGRRRQVRRVLRPRRRAPAARRPRDARQHEPRVRLDLRDLPDRRRDAALHGVHRAPGGADRADRGLRQGAGPVARRRRSEEPTFSDTVSLDLGDGRAVDRRAAAPAGPRRADRCADARSARSSRATSPTSNSHDEEVEESFPASDPAASSGPGSREPQHEPNHGRHARRRRPEPRTRAGHDGRRHRDRSSITATS